MLINNNKVVKQGVVKMSLAKKYIRLVETREDLTNLVYDAFRLADESPIVAGGGNKFYLVTDPEPHISTDRLELEFIQDTVSLVDAITVGNIAIGSQVRTSNGSVQQNWMHRRPELWPVEQRSEAIRDALARWRNHYGV